MRKLWMKWHRWCVREKGHLVVGGGYLGMIVWHDSALMVAAYGVAALMATHKIYRDGVSESRGKHMPKHLAQD